MRERPSVSPRSRASCSSACFIADLVGETPTRESIAMLRDDIAELSAQLDEGERSAAEVSFERRVRSKI